MTQNVRRNGSSCQRRRFGQLETISNRRAIEWSVPRCTPDDALLELDLGVTVAAPECQRAGRIQALRIAPAMNLHMGLLLSLVR
jgi:hypothetical protein